MFGLPCRFHGYYDVGLSEGSGRHHNNFTWAILKAHTRNGDGTRGVAQPDPRDTPTINFHYFNELTARARATTIRISWRWSKA